MPDGDSETWIFTVKPLRSEVPAVIRVRSALKVMLRCFGLKCVAYEESAEVQRLRKIVDGLAARVAAQSELLSRHAERRRDTA